MQLLTPKYTPRCRWRHMAIPSFQTDRTDQLLCLWQEKERWLLQRCLRWWPNQNTHHGMCSSPMPLPATATPIFAKLYTCHWRGCFSATTQFSINLTKGKHNFYTEEKEFKVLRNHQIKHIMCTVYELTASFLSSPSFNNYLCVLS